MKTSIKIISTIIVLTTISANVVYAQATKNKPLVNSQSKSISVIVSKANIFINERVQKLKMIELRIKNLESTSSIVNSTDISNLITSYNIDIQNLNTLKATIDSYPQTGSMQNLMVLVRQIFAQYKIYSIELPTGNALVYLGILAQFSNNYNVIGENLLKDISFAKSKNVNTQNILNDYNMYLTDVALYNQDLTSAINLEQSINISNYPQNIAQIKLLHQDMVSLHQQKALVHKDFTRFINDFEMLFNIGMRKNMKMK